MFSYLLFVWREEEVKLNQETLKVFVKVAWTNTVVLNELSLQKTPVENVQEEFHTSGKVKMELELESTGEKNA